MLEEMAHRADEGAPLLSLASGRRKFFTRALLSLAGLGIPPVVVRYDDRSSGTNVLRLTVRSRDSVQV